MIKNLSQLIAELLARPMESEELSSQILRLGEELRKVIHSEDMMFGRFRGLLESFRTIIPDEKQRYQAALQALSTTSKLSRQEIIAALNAQIEELKILEKGLMPAQHAWRAALNGLEARSQQLKGEIAQLRERLGQLEGEEKAIQAGMSAQEKDLSIAESTMKELFANIGAEISALNMKMEEFTAEAPAAQPALTAAPPIPPAAQPGPKAEPRNTDAASRRKKGGEQTVEIQAAPPPQDTKYRRKCPMCGGPFNLLELENIWQCYTCAYEEPNNG